ncbi:uncharacterized protein V1518DRAFT_99858 [Limtongia smithiae]|uniref:uncharacterized protein n=1 Tax=Limtongia smithiae TaxID=1125753 RepID=UPI0034CE81E7
MSLTDDEWIAFEAYDWDNDKQFTDGLATVIRSAPATAGPLTDAQQREVECNARLYFYSRKVQKNAVYADYATWLQQRHTSDAAGPEESIVAASEKSRSSTPQRTGTTSPPTTSGSPSLVPTPASATDIASPPAPSNTPYPSSFAHIIELITSGKEIPGIKRIPNITLGDAAASQSERAVRSKPWERGIGRGGGGGVGEFGL